MRLVRALVLIALLGVCPASAIERCGDDVDGQGTAVACACGDLLVSSRTLGASDPVTSEPCSGNGLMIDADAKVVLALGGRTIAGSGQGIGVLVLRGQLALAGPGTITGFETGVFARRAGGLASARDVRLADNRLDGLAALGDGFTVEGVVSEGNGRDGFSLAGSGYALDGNRAARNGRHGFRVAGVGAHVGGGLGNEARENVGDGFSLAGRMHQILGATADGNGGDGVGGVVAQVVIDRLHADANLGSGLFAYGSGVTLRDSRAEYNHGFGLWIDGTGNTDGGGNAGEDNEGLTRSANGPSASYTGWSSLLVQCSIGAELCR
jgi:hypothetical protein